MLPGLALDAHLVEVVDGRVLAGLVEPESAVAGAHHGGGPRRAHICLARPAGDGGRLPRARFIMRPAARRGVKRWEKIFAWVAIIGGGIGIFLLSDVVVDLMR